MLSTMHKEVSTENSLSSKAEDPGLIIQIRSSHSSLPHGRGLTVNMPLMCERIAPIEALVTSKLST